MVSIIWTDEATESFDRIVDFLLQVWDIEVANKFVDLTKRKLNSLLITPELGMLISEKVGLRKTVVQPNAVLFYQYISGSSFVTIILLSDTREDPAKLNRI